MDKQVVGFGIGQQEGIILGANLGCTIVTSGDFVERHGPVPKLLWADLLHVYLSLIHI